MFGATWTWRSLPCKLFTSLRRVYVCVCVRMCVHTCAQGLCSLFLYCYFLATFRLVSVTEVASYHNGHFPQTAAAASPPSFLPLLCLPPFLRFFLLGICLSLSSFFLTSFFSRAICTICQHLLVQHMHERLVYTVAARRISNFWWF